MIYIRRQHSQVSIHARAWRATPHPPLSGKTQGVSIHARAWRATRWPTPSWSGRNRFNPRPRMAGDVLEVGVISRLRVSIHARAGRTTGCATSSTRLGGGFNPRPRMAGDRRTIHGSHAPNLFQSTPAHGGRRCSNRSGYPWRCVSIHARAWRATVTTMGTVSPIDVSIHARAWRATRAGWPH